VKIPLALAVWVWVCAACGSSSVPAAPARPHPASAYDRVPYPPPSALAEIVPEQPRSDAIWVDGHWVWRGRYYVWERGGWVVPPEGSFIRRWHARYEPDGTLLYAPTTWHEESGRPLPAPEFLLPAATPPTEETAEPATIP
jgi:hypothetical protein